MNKLLATLIGALLATSVHAQVTANSPAIGQAVSGNNATAAGTSGTGLRTDGTAKTGSAQAATAREAAGIDASGKVVGPGTAVIGTTPGKMAHTNDKATNTAPQGTPDISVPSAVDNAARADDKAAADTTAPQPAPVAHKTSKKKAKSHKKTAKKHAETASK